MSDSDRPEHRAYRELELLVRNLGDELAGFRRRALMAEARLKEVTNLQSIPIVAVIKPNVGGNKSSLDLPGRLEAYARAPIYARVSGFLKAWYVDIGAQVKAGQLLLVLLVWAMVKRKVLFGLIPR